MDGWVWIAAAGVFFFGVFVYLIFMIFLPEWVGITGKKALEAEKSHQGGAETGAEFLSTFQKEHKRSNSSSSSDEQS